MSSIALTLSLRSRLLSGGALSAYAVGSFDPEFVLDFENEYYRTNNSSTTFDSAITHDRDGNATMHDGTALKWAPHNLLTSSTTITGWGTINTADISISEEVYTLSENLTTGGHSVGIACSLSAETTGVVEIKANGRTKGGFDLGTSSGTYRANFDLVAETIDTAGTAVTASSITSLGDGWYRLSMTATNSNAFRIVIKDDSGALSYTGDGVSGFLFRYPHAYRSDLGSMVNNSDRGDSYVPTTSAARYLPRRGHHVYNGAEWVNEGVLVESEARTNLVTYSNDFSQWTVLNTDSVTITADQATGPDGATTLDLLEITDTTTETKLISRSGTTTSGATLTFSVYLRDDDQRYVQILIVQDGVKWGSAIVDLQTLSITQENDGSAATTLDSGVEDLGGGLCRAYVTVQMDAGSTNVVGYIGFSNSATPTLASNGGISYSGTAGLGFYAGFAQLEAGSTPSSYIPTSGSTVTRAADTLTVPSANLPWPTPNVIGEELVTNGTFDTDTDWTKSIGWTISGGTANHDGTGAGSQIDQPSALISGRVYVVTFDLVVTSGSGVAFRPTKNSGTEQIQFTTSGSKSLYFVSGDGGVTFAALASFVGTIDNISVREIDPLAVSIQMEGRMTYADEDQLFEVEFVKWGSAGNAIRSFIRSLSNNLSFEQSVSGVYDTVTATMPTPGINVPFNIASRHGSTFINGAVDGTALTADTTPTALPDLSTTDLSLAYSGGPMILKKVRIFADDIGDSGLEEAST